MLILGAVCFVAGGIVCGWALRGRFDTRPAEPQPHPDLEWLERRLLAAAELEYASEVRWSAGATSMADWKDAELSRKRLACQLLTLRGTMPDRASLVAAYRASRPVETEETSATVHTDDTARMKVSA